MESYGKLLGFEAEEVSFSFMIFRTISTLETTEINPYSHGYKTSLYLPGLLTGCPVSWGF